ncbi:MAG: DUF434 domain-containing protein [Phycisphaerae bacterium]
MPDKRNHRGPHPDDQKLFSSSQLESLSTAVSDYSLLLTKGYADVSSLKLVCDHFSLTQRQRLAVMRSACSDSQLKLRKKSQIGIADIAGQSIAIDGYNVLITIEAAKSGAFLFRGRDGCLRDLASIHGTYRKVQETIPAIELIGEFLKEYQVSSAVWFLDKPVSNSGRLKKILEEIAEQNSWSWQVKLSQSPDAELKKCDCPIASSDSAILDNCNCWFNLAAEIIEKRLLSGKTLNLYAN